jgi:DNA-binding LytR/AlgR family response regulator
VNVIIVESDEVLAGSLRSWTMGLGINVNVPKVAEGVHDAASYFRNGGDADLILLDTHLRDGKGFDFLSEVSPDIPVVFIADTDGDVFGSFQFNTLQFLMKPVKREQLKAVFEKFRRITVRRNGSSRHPDPLPESNGYRKRFLIKTGNKIQVKNVDEVSFFFAEGKTAFLVTRNGNRKFMIDHTLEELEKTLDPNVFFRINRKHIVSVDSIAEVRKLAGGKFSVKVLPASDQEFTVSRERMSGFKDWLDR